jgi:Carbohydrate-binding module 48 (Isoamylase N-terminal domain)
MQDHRSRSTLLTAVSADCWWSFCSVSVSNDFYLAPLRITFRFSIIIVVEKGHVAGHSSRIWITRLEDPKNTMSLKKQYLKKPRVCKVTFSLPKEAAGSAANVSLVGDFNEWSKETVPMKRLKNGTFTATVTLEPSKEYHFRYFVDGQRWENDWHADKYVPNSHGSDDSVVVV